MPSQHPDRHLAWVPDANSSNLAQPPSSISATGFQAGQPLPAPWLNYALHNLDQWAQFLAEGVNSTVLATSLNHSMRLIGGGQWSFAAASGALSWSDTLILSIPSAKDSDNQVPAGQAIVPPGSVAYVNVNFPFSTTADYTEGSATVTSLGYEAGIEIGMAVSGEGIPAGTTVLAVNGSSLTLSAEPTSSAEQGMLSFNSTGALTVKVAPAASLVPGPNTVVLARALETVCSIGIGSTEIWLRDQEARALSGTGYVTVQDALAGEALPAVRAVYLSRGAADGRTQGSAYLCDASAARGGQRGTCAGFVPVAIASGSSARIVRSGFLQGFSGLIPGAAYYLDPATPGAITPTRPTTTGLFVAPVGTATSPSTLLVHISAAAQLSTTFPELTVTGASTLAAVTATSVSSSSVSATGTVSANNMVSASGFKSSIYLGKSIRSAYNGGDQLLGEAILDLDTGVTQYQSRIFIPAFSGSIVGVGCSIYTGKSSTVGIKIFVNGTKTYEYNFYNVFNDKAGSFQIAKGACPFNPNDQITVSVTASLGAQYLAASATAIVEFAA